MRAALIAITVTLLAAPVAAQMPGAAEVSRMTAGTYQVDPSHTQVTWKVNHMGFSMLQGQFGASGGTLTLDPAKPAAAKVEISFDMTQLTTTAPAFTKHLNSPDFFDTAKFGTARFVSTSVTPGANNTATIAGNLTVKGITKPVTLQAHLIGAGSNPMNKKLNVGFHATAKIKRSDFGAGMAAPVVSDDVDLEINAAFVK
jgi:polyisoprenoid-binding protein YceI